MDFSIRKSLKLPQHSLSRKHDDMNEKLPILQGHDEDQAMRSGNTSDRKEMIVKIDGDGRREVGEAGKIWRGSSYEFWKDDEERVNAAVNGGGFRFPELEQKSEFEVEVADDPPSKLIGQFLHRQQASGEISLDMDLEMDELQPGRTGLAPVAETVNSKELKVTFSPSKAVEEKGRKSDMDGSEVVRCTSNDAHQKKSTLLRSKSKSRLMDPAGPEQNDRKGRSGQLKSGFLSGRTEEEEDDPFLDEDLPDEYKKFKFGLVTMAEWISLILIIAALVCSLTILVLRTKTLWNLNLWKWEVLDLVVVVAEAGLKCL